MITAERLLEDGFFLETYPDGLFYIYRLHNECFLQVDEALTNITLYDNGWVEDNLTDQEYENTLRQFKDKDSIYL